MQLVARTFPVYVRVQSAAWACPVYAPMQMAAMLFRVNYRLDPENELTALWMQSV